MDKAEIVNEVNKNIEFFRQQWQIFCDMVEKYGKHVAGCLEDPALKTNYTEEDKGQQLLRKLLKENNSLIHKFNATSKKISRLELQSEMLEQKKELKQKLLKNRENQAKARKTIGDLEKSIQNKVLRITELTQQFEPPEPGYIRYPFAVWPDDYLHLPMNKNCWITPGHVNPLLWFDFIAYMIKQRNPTDEECLLIACVRLAILHDYGVDRGCSEQTITGRYKPYKGYFERNVFCWALIDYWKDKQDADRRIKEAFNRVLPVIKRKKADLATGKSTGMDIKEESMEVPWDDDNPDYMLNSEAITTFTGSKMPLSKLSKLLTPDGPMHYMRKGQRCKVHIGEFRNYASKQYVSDEIANEIADEVLADREARRKVIDRKKKRTGK